MFFKLAARFVRWADWSSDWSGKITGFLIFGLIGLMMFEVVRRYIFHMPTIWASPSLIYLYAWYAIVGGAFTLLNNQHVRMDALYMRFSARRQAIMDAATSVCIFVVAGMLIYTGIDHTVVSILSGEKAFSAWHEVIWPVRMCIPVGAFLLLVQAIAKFLRNLSVIFRGTDFEYKNQSPYVKMV